MNVGRFYKGVVLTVLFSGILGMGVLVGGIVASAEQIKADLNKDGVVTAADMLILQECIKAKCGNLAYDLNGDGTVDEKDMDNLKSQYGLKEAK